MRLPGVIRGPLALLDRSLDALQGPVLLVARCFVSWQFLKSGWLKLEDWDTTLALFQDEYRTPILSPAVAAVAGTLGELVFPVLLILGLFGRFAATGLFLVNVMAVVSYAHVLLAPGFETALGQHVLWGLLLALLAVQGPGRLALDHWLGTGKGTGP